MAGVFSVSQVISYIKIMFAQDFALSRISVRGEVSNCKYHPSGHIFFTLKDGGGVLSCGMVAGHRKGLSFSLREGMRVIVTGTVDVYERDGRYQLYARKIEADGRGDLFERFVKLRDELEEMGMFAAEYKQPIPKYATRIGIVTADTGAAIRDIMNIAARRNPYVQLVLYPALVQGERAAASIVSGIEALDELDLDVLIVGRGGGSMEDLWAFNEEAVARAIFNCRTPVISAVGHETDVTIADYVADLRAPTPSAAAELAVFDWRHFEEELRGYETALARGMTRELERRRYLLSQYRLRLKLYDPERRLRDRRQRLADMAERLESAMNGRLEKARRQQKDRERLAAAFDRKLLSVKHRLALASGRLDGLSPLKRISGGFGFLTDEEGRRITHVYDVETGAQITVRISDGRIRARVTERTEYGDGKRE
ncbi:MAG: exodeoxyribonuclease VII large subunit [Clostridiales bacterium]|nr:exodeoxyribonuclease VII large subunit [Clostridiales bacterium]